MHWLLFLAVLTCFPIYIVSLGSQPQAHFDHPDAKFHLLWAQYSPYSPAATYTPKPEACTITQVNILQRHGARYPTSKASKTLIKVVDKLQGASKFSTHRLHFLKNYKYSLGENELVPLGIHETFDAGALCFARYKELISESSLPFLRASSAVQVVASAEHWIEGFSLASQQRYRPKLSVIMSEEGNDTLDNHMCPNAGTSHRQLEIWESIYALPTAKRLNSVAYGANLTARDVYNLLSLCVFETVATGLMSHFCGIFDAADFEGFEYRCALHKYYGSGYGQVLGRIQGVGYINELLARLTSSPVDDHTQTNRTLDSDPETFPLNKTIYADFAHESLMMAIYTALGLFKQVVDLDPTNSTANANRTWIPARLVPFAGRMVVEKLRCGQEGEGEYVRILVNDALQTLSFCGSGEDGLCTLEAFVESQEYARQSGCGDFEKCFEKR